MPFDLRMVFFWYRLRMAEAVRCMIAWAPERVVVAHGRWCEANGEEELRRRIR